MVHKISRSRIFWRQSWKSTFMALNKDNSLFSYVIIICTDMICTKCIPPYYKINERYRFPIRLYHFILEAVNSPDNIKLMGVLCGVFRFIYIAQSDEKS